MKHRFPFFRLIEGLLVLGFAGAAAAAGIADISSVPPSTLTTGTVRANLMFILDDSGSMADDFIPEIVGGNRAKRCFGYVGYNRMFFDPSIKYDPPVDSTGAPLQEASFNAAYLDGFTRSGTARNLADVSNLSTSSVVLSTNSSSTGNSQTCAKNQSPCTLAGKTTTTTSSNTVSGITTATRIDTTYGSLSNNGQTCSTISNSCKIDSTVLTTETLSGKPYWSTLNSGATNNCSDANYTPVYTGLTSEQQQNYANWYQYYRTRMLLMRSASGRVFAAIDPTRFRVGFSTISYTGVTDGTEFLNIADFDAGTGATSQKAKFFTRLYGQAPSGSTPLRPALDKAGKYFAKKVAGQATDPMQYSCQRNYTLLSTDGYWNTSNEPYQFKPQKLVGGEIGDQDGALASAPRPKYDSAAAKNSLADIAKYYFDTDLRTTDLLNCSGSVTGQNVCVNRDPIPGDTTTPLHQNMTTYTLGLGVTGVLNYQPDYDTAPSGDFADIVAGTKNWPDPLSSSNSGYPNTSNTVTARIDDLWHAAVNGGGRYYSARNPNELVEGLTDALQKIDAKVGSASAASTSTLEPVPGDDWVFIPSYETQTWVGDIGAYHFQINAQTGTIGVSNTASWSAAKTLAAQATRRILFFDSSTANKLNDFTFANLPTSLQSSFSSLCQVNAFKLSQCSALSPAALGKFTGENVIDYLRGSRQYELSQANVDDRLFRVRMDNKEKTWTPLGDVINGSPAYVRLPPFKYTDAGYSAFRDAQKSREGVLYVAANDGMLHAFRASDGHELWAYVPTQVIPKMYKLADSAYGNSHQYFVDGSPVVADVFDGSGWRTILVGGLGAGGRGYYALDVTDPSAPKALWEYADADMGLSFGEPVITKNKAGTWVVAVTSGYNNTAGDGNGHLYVLNAVTGVRLAKIETLTAAGSKAGSPSAPSNLGRIAAWVDSEKDNTARRIYGGDMLGNIWRFDFDDNLAPAGSEALQLGIAQDGSGKAQPITVQPQLSEQGSGASKVAVVSVGTGRYLGSSDLGDTTVQSVYSFKDSLGAAGLGILRASPLMVKQTMNANHILPSAASVDWTQQQGWYVDFDQSSGERVNIGMDLQLNILTVATTVPTPTPCSPGGMSWLYYFGMDSGKILGSYESITPIVGVATLMEGSNTNQPRTITLTTKNDKSIARYERPPDPRGGAGAGAARRTSWRELIN